MLKSLMLLVNPYSGKGKAKDALYYITSLFWQNGYAPTVYFAGGENSVSSLAREYAGRYDMIVCVGGDGTLSDAVTGLMEVDSPPPVGYIPMGTANDMATTLDLSHDPYEAALDIMQGKAVPLDIGHYGDSYFTYVAAFGAFTEVSYSTPQNEKRALGHLAYVFRGISSLSTIKPRHTVVEYDDGVIEDDFIFGGVTNSTSVAGLVKLNPDDVSLSDGKFEIILVRRPMDIAEFVKLINSVVRSEVHTDNIVFLHSEKVKFTFDTDVEWTRDGENGGKHRVLEIENRNKAIQIIL
ncbi:MAG: YegS/Rv2252/BmrU family lipid kinase [Oscillospiraceae bacterium]|nr:YegS/Rv2252/BmrU family lipid kinase [Oscillospiraceae bacterium]